MNAQTLLAWIGSPSHKRLAALSDVVLALILAYLLASTAALYLGAGQDDAPPPSLTAMQVPGGGEDGAGGAQAAFPTLFGEEAKAPPPAPVQAPAPVPEAPKEVPPPPLLKVTIKGILHLPGNPLGSWAIVYHVPKLAEDFFGVGDWLWDQEALVREIQEDRVVFERGGYLESVWLDGRQEQVKYEGKPAALPNVNREERVLSRTQQKTAREPGEEVRYAENSYQASKMRSLREQLLTDPDKVADIIHYQLRYEGLEGLKGIVLSPGSDFPLLNRMGFFAGDEVVAINGFPITDLDTLFGLYANLENMDALELEVMRKGQRYYITIPLTKPKP